CCPSSKASTPRGSRCCGRSPTRCWTRPSASSSPAPWPGCSACRPLAEVLGRWSGRQDSNLRPPAPKAGALPGCATPRGPAGNSSCRPPMRPGPGPVGTLGRSYEHVPHPTEDGHPMNSTVEELDGNKVKVSVSVDETEFDKDIDAAFKRIAQEVNLPGFRRGKAPRKLLEARLGAGVAREEALREALPKYYADAVTEHDVDVIAAPELEITSGQEEGPVEFEAIVEIRPVVTVPGYDGLK